MLEKQSGTLRRGVHRNRLWRLPLRLGFVDAIALTTLPCVIEAIDQKPDDTGKKADKKDHFSGPLSSQPIALSADDLILAVANSDNNSVSLFHIKRHLNFGEVKVQKEPRGLALTPVGKLAFVTNTGHGTVSVIEADRDGDHNKFLGAIERLPLLAAHSTELAHLPFTGT